MDVAPHDDPLVSTHWMAEHTDDPWVQPIEVDLGPDEAYPFGHVPGAVLWRVWGDLLGLDERLIDDPAHLERLLSRSGITPETTVVLYGDLWNWGATLAFWVLRALGHRDARIMDGGRDKWLAEGRPADTEPPEVAPSTYPVTGVDWSDRARLGDVRTAIGSPRQTILDVRLPDGTTWRNLVIPEVAKVAETLAEFRGRHLGVFGFDPAASRAAAEHVQSRSTPHDSLLVFGFEPQVYVYSGRRALTRHASDAPLTGETSIRETRRLAWFSELMADLRRQPPLYIVESAPPQPRPEWCGPFWDLLAADYQWEASYGQLKVYRRKSALNRARTVTP